MHLRARRGVGGFAPYGMSIEVCSYNKERTGGQMGETVL